MGYLALGFDHRVVDGLSATTSWRVSSTSSKAGIRRTHSFAAFLTRQRNAFRLDAFLPAVARRLRQMRFSTSVNRQTHVVQADKESNMRTLEVRRLGLMPYGSALDLQRTLVEQRRAGAIGDQLLLVEHPHVLTLGVRGDGGRAHPGVR